MKKQSKLLKADALDNGVIRLQLTATQALLFAAKDVGKGFTKLRFHKLLNTQDGVQLTNYTYTVNSRQAFPATEETVAEMLDAVINARNAFVHYKDERRFYNEAVVQAQQLIQRYPELRQKCATEALIVETYDSLKQCFQF